MAAPGGLMSSFAPRGRLILYQGVGDQGLSILDTIDWYKQLDGGDMQPLDSWARLFPIPGMAHCRGGYATTDFDLLGTLEAWVERGVVPEHVVAHSSGSDPSHFSRPLCPYPKIARYKGEDTSLAGSFACEVPLDR